MTVGEVVFWLGITLLSTGLYFVVDIKTKKDKKQLGWALVCLGVLGVGFSVIKHFADKPVDAQTAPPTQQNTVTGSNNNTGNVNQSGDHNTSVIGNNNKVGVPADKFSGWLRPAHDPTPANPCAQRIIDQGGYIVFLGPMAFGATKMPNIVLGVGALHTKPFPLLTLDKNKRGELALSADVYSNDDIVVEFKDGKYTVSNDAFKVEKPDPSTLEVTIKRLKEKVLQVRFLNAHAIKILGHFQYPNASDLRVDDTALTVNTIPLRGGGCAVNSGPGLPDFQYN
jgi:hypothetical protein